MYIIKANNKKYYIHNAQSKSDALKKLQGRVGVLIDPKIKFVRTKFVGHRVYDPKKFMKDR